MLKSLPIIGTVPIVQRFGDHPEQYGTIACAGVPLRGHNGIDYGAPLGTPVLAVQDGTILELGNEADGFGTYIVMGHEWGQTLYAHLEQATVVQGQVVSGGSQIGLSGNSGRSSSPHLHFGMRISPFSLADGWCGYSDPQPYLTRLTQPRGAIIGPHIVGGIHKHLAMLKQWQPRLILVVDPNPDEMRDLRATCPDAVIIGRIFATDQDVEHRIRANPQQAAQWAHDMTMARLTPAVDYWQIANEVLQKPDGLPLLNQFELARMALAEANGYHCAIFAFSVGNPDLPEADRMADWQVVYPALEQAEANGHIVALHQYGMPDLWGPDGLTDWLIYRLEHQVLRRLPYKKLQFAVTEYGIDGLIQGPSPAGWQRFTSAQAYAAQLLRSGSYTERFSGRILGYAVFTLGHNAPWGSYDIEGEAAWALANQSARGTWADVTVTSGDWGEAGDTSTAPGTAPSTDPGIDAGGDAGGATTTTTGPSTPTEPDVSEPEITEPIPTEPDSGENGAAMKVPIDRRITDWVNNYNMQIVDISARPDGPTGDDVYVVKDIFTTRNGSFEPSAEPGAIPQWARDAYLKPEFLEAGADHHLFAAVLDEEGNFIKGQPIRYWSDGLAKLGDADYDGYVREQTKESSGWANMFMAGGSSFVPERGESGPWCWAPEGAAEVVCGGGLPANHHISTFVVWQKMKRAELEEGSTGPGVTEPATPTEPEQPTEPETPIEPEQPTEPATPTEPETPTEPATPIEPGTGAEPPFERRISDWANQFNMGHTRFDQRPDVGQLDGEFVYVLKDLFTTYNGSWEPSHSYASVPQWARDAYLKPFGAPDYFDDAGGDHHLFAAVLGPDGEMLHNHKIRYWSDGINQLGNPDYAGFVERETKEKSGWINIPLGPGSSYVPERGESGPWCWAPEGASDVICGGGLPAKNHVSTFAVWQAVRREDLVGGDTGDVGQPVTPVTPTQPTQPTEPTQPLEPDKPPIATPPSVVRRISPWAEKFNLTIRGLDERPDAPSGDVVYVVKDVFTTHNGSWEPDDSLGSIPQWARDSYLKPMSSPDYFDDAGGDHHLFAAVIGLDGQLIGGKEIAYWSDGFSKIDVPDYTGFVFRTTKDKSGWINIPVGPGSSFVPERGESGPWCWAPLGAAEVICGGGLPAKNHISTFVVWQAVPREEVETSVPESTENLGEHTIFLPFVTGGGPSRNRDVPVPTQPASAPEADGQATPVSAADDAAVTSSDAPLIDLAGLDALRTAAWNRTGLDYSVDSSLAAYARYHNLGMPVTQEFEVGGYIVQGFQSGIVFAPADKREALQHMPW